ncbi:hypothetical protein DRQ50_09265, partial [bacterium]
MELNLVGTVKGEEVRLELVEGVLVVGRGADTGLRLAEASVSRRHAEVRRIGDNVTVQDLDSRNGTRVNGQPVTEPTLVQPGDRLDFAGLIFRLEGPATVGATSLNESGTLVPREEISWEEVRSRRADKRDRQSHLFQVMAEAGDLLTTRRAPEELYEPILDLVQTALDPERIFILLVEDDSDEPVVKATRLLGARKEGSLALSRTMVQRVLTQKTSFLTTDPLNDPMLDGAMSMVSQSIRTAVASPLFDNEEVIGLLYADDSRAGKRISRDELQAFTLLANGIAVAITHARYHAMEEEKARQDAELATAGSILDHILPSDLPTVEGYDLQAHLEPCLELGGDLYDARMMDDGRLAFLLGDVVGKGLGAALLVSQILSLSRFMLGEQWEPAPLIERLNREIFLSTDHVRFATAFMGYLEPDTGRVTCVNAGHNQPVLVRADGTVQQCATGGLPVGVIAESEYPTASVNLEPGDTLALFSDGIPETANDQDDEYGEERFGALVA